MIYDIEKANITEIIDGDTIETDLGKVRLLGINTPEKGRFGYEEAKNFLLQLENKEVELIRVGENKDRYSRLLRYVFYQGKNINEEILSRGLAHLYYYNEDDFISKLKKAEQKARDTEIGIWQPSQGKCAECIILVELNHIDPGEYVILKNICSFECDLNEWTIKDDTASHIFTLDFSIEAGQEKKIDFEGRIWNDDGDTLYLQDEKGLLVLWSRY